MGFEDFMQFVIKTSKRF